MQTIERVAIWVAFGLVMMLLGSQLTHRKYLSERKPSVVLGGAPVRSLATVSVDTLAPDLYAVTIRDKVLGRDSRPVYLSLGEPVAVVEWGVSP